MQLSVDEHFRLQKRSKLSIRTSTAGARFDKPWSKAQDCRHSIDAHFHDGAGSVTLFLLPSQDGNNSIMCNHYQIAFWLTDLQDQKLLTLRWRAFSRWDTECLASIFAYKGCQFCCYVFPLLNYFLITRITRSKNVDALLTLIFNMGQGACCFLLSL